MPLVILLALISSGTVNAAAYMTAVSANVVPFPSGGYAAKNVTFSAGKATAQASVKVAGQVINFPVKMGIAANAAQYAITKSRGNPYLIVGALAAFYLSYDLTVENDQIIKTVSVGPTLEQMQSCYGAPLYTGAGGTACNNPSVFCPGENYRNPNYSALTVECIPSGVIRSFTYCYYGSGLPRCTTSVVKTIATESDFTPLSNASIPDNVASQLSQWSEGVLAEFNSTWSGPTVSQPISTPYTKPDGSTAVEEAHVTHSPTPEDPLRVRVDTTEKPLTTPTGEPIPSPAPSTIVTTITGDKSQPQETVDPCTKRPNSVGCLNSGDIPESGEIGNRTINVGIITPIQIGSTGSCPAPVTMNVSGHVITAEWDWLCRYAEGMRPIVIAVAWFSAALIIAGMRNTENAP